MPKSAAYLPNTAYYLPHTAYYLPRRNHKVRGNIPVIAKKCRLNAISDPEFLQKIMHITGIYLLL